MKIFYSTPFSSKLDGERVRQDYREALEELFTETRNAGHELYSALEFSNWMMGGKLLPQDEFKHDLEQIDDSDVVIALLEKKVSAGV